jgi:hypothetical protein
MERLAALTGGYGHTARERERVAELIASIEPLLAACADFEIDTREPIHATVGQILHLARTG